MEAEGKALLKDELMARRKTANTRLHDVQTNTQVAAAAVELWTELNDLEELGAATVAHFTALLEQKMLGELIARLERGIEFLHR